MLDPATLHTLILDSLEDQIAVIDRDGAIVFVNRAWTAFGIENGLVPEFHAAGGNYLKVCDDARRSGDSLAAEAERGIRDVLGGKRATFYFEYPCHSPQEKRWFMMRVTVLQGAADGYYVISHHKITQRKLAEEQVEYLSLHDPLTGLSNRRHFDQVLRNEWRRSIRNQTPISFIMLDIDYFKDYNDALGHLAGDQCLVKVGRALQVFSGRPSDLAVRYGGEEFGLLLGNTDAAAAAKIAEGIRSGIRELDIRFGGTRRVTVSAGVASAIPAKGQADTSLVREADQALYRAKQEGRDRIVCAQPVAASASVFTR